MLNLDDPLWRKLDDAHRDTDIPLALKSLAERWDGRKAQHLFWGCLCHQKSCYGATYAVIPHLLEIAAPDVNRHQRLEIAVFLGIIALNSSYWQNKNAGRDDAALSGLPETLREWDKSLDCYRNLVHMIDTSNKRIPQYLEAKLPRYREILQIGPIDEDDLLKVRAIKQEFISSLPQIRTLCERAFLENTDDEDARRYLLSGIAAADGLTNLASALQSGLDGQFVCSACDWGYEYILFKDRIALYAEKISPSQQDRGLEDYKDGVPTRADAFMVPIDDTQPLSDARVMSLLNLAHQGKAPELSLLMRNFLGHFACVKCGRQAAPSFI